MPFFESLVLNPRSGIEPQVSRVIDECSND